MSYKPTPETPDLLPYLIVRDIEKSLAFYTEAFGFTILNTARDEAQQPMHVEMSKHNALVMFCAEGAYGNTKKAPATLGITMPLTLYIYCEEDIDTLYAHAIKNGAQSVQAPDNAFWGDRYCTLLDIDGYEWSFGQYLGQRTPRG